MDPWTNTVGNSVNDRNGNSASQKQTDINLDDTTEKSCKTKDNRSLTEYIEDFGNESTHHGMRFFTSSKYNIFRRLLWAAIVVGADAYLAIQIFNSVDRYYSHEVNTLVSVEYVSGELDFPAVTICNYNQWRKSMADEETLALINLLYSPRDDLDLAINWTVFEEFLEDEPVGDDSDFEDYVLASAHQLEDMLLECKWRGGSFCDHRNFTTVLTDWGVCYTFNNPQNRSEILKINQPGTNSGLFLRLLVEQDEYIAGEQTGAGFKVLLHKQGVRPLLKELGFAVSPGFETLVTVNYETVSRLPDPYTDCYENKNQLSFTDKYTVPLCNHECKVKYVIENCACRDYRYPDFIEQICNPKKMLECVYVYEEKFLTEGIVCDCPAPCYSEKFEAKTSIAYFPNDYVASQLRPVLNVSEEWMRKNALDVRIFFEELSYSSVKQTEAYTSADLISDIGGNMGLMAGMSLITILEIFDFIVNTLWRKCCKNTARI